MPWTQLIVAFLAGYGLMSLALWLLASLGWYGNHPLTASAIVLAGDDEERIESILRTLHSLWEENCLAEVVIRTDGQDSTRSLVERLAASLPCLCLLPEGATLMTALETVKGDTTWVIDLAKIQGGIDLGRLPVPGRPNKLRRANCWTATDY